MYLIGLSGGIASGKSTVSRMLIDLGAHVIDADQIARQIVFPGQPVWQAIVQEFGRGILLEDETLDRIKLGEKIFNHESAKRLLNDIMHPSIKEKIKMQIAVGQQKGESVIVLDIPLLYEAGWDKCTDENWVVYVKQSTQLVRLQKRNHLSLAQAKSRIHSQMPLEEKVKRADFVIDNEQSLRYTEEQVIKRWESLSILKEKVNKSDG